MKSINGKTTVLAIFGDPVVHSLSPTMHNAAFKELNWNCVYVPFRVAPDDISLAVRSIRTLGLKGVNVTIPHKQAVVSELDEIIGDAKLSGSVNTIINQEGKLVGASTDGSGFIRSLREEGNFDASGKNVILFGAGGGAIAVIYKLIAQNIKSLTVVNRNFAKAVNIQEKVWFDTQFEINVFDLKDLPKLTWENYDLLINTTSVGLHDEATLVPQHFLNPNMFVYDLVYKKGDTTLVNQAKKVGCSTLAGLSMLLYQGVESFKLWFETEPPVEVMQKALHEIK